MNDSRLEIIGFAAAGIAHDVNNQLTLIVNHLAVDDIAAARRAAERCAALTNSLLTYCRREPVSIETIEPASFLQAFVEDLRLPAGISLELNTPDLLPPIAADAIALNRILSNLIANACDAMDGRGKLRITAAPLIIEIADSGPGIPADVAERIFDPFFTTKGAAGTGLGLSIVGDLMRRLGGSVAVASEPGRGGCFRLRFSEPAVG